MDNRNFIPADVLTMRAQRILHDHGFDIPYIPITDAIYLPLRALAAELIVGDTIELPDGTTLKVVWKP